MLFLKTKRNFFEISSTYLTRAPLAARPSESTSLPLQQPIFASQSISVCIIFYSQPSSNKQSYKKHKTLSNQESTYERRALPFSVGRQILTEALSCFNTNLAFLRNDTAELVSFVSFLKRRGRGIFIDADKSHWLKLATSETFLQKYYYFHCVVYVAEPHRFSVFIQNDAVQFFHVEVAPVQTFQPIIITVKYLQFLKKIIYLPLSKQCVSFVKLEYSKYDIFSLQKMYLK